jgi:hypothetical protein
MSSLWLIVEVRPGADIAEACRDSVALAGRLGIVVWFGFNGVKCLARPGDNPEKIEAECNYILADRNTGVRIASDRDGGQG